MTDLITAPWTDAQIAALNAFQRSGRMHPFTCGAEHSLHQTLIAERDGWRCPDEQCDYRQNWAHAHMADPNFLSAMQHPGVAEHIAVFTAARRAYAPPDPMAAELGKVRQQLRDTENDLAKARRLIAELTARREAELIHEAIQRIPAQPPDPDGGLCDPSLAPARPFNDVPTGGLL